MLGLRTPDGVGPAPSVPDPILHAAGPVIDLGCGSGRLLVALRANGVIAFGVERDAERVDFARRAGLDVFQGDIANPKSFARSPAAACLVSVLTALPLKAERRAILDSLGGWLGGNGRVWIRDFERLSSAHATVVSPATIEAYERRYSIGPGLAARLWGKPPIEWVDGTFVAFHPGSRVDDWSRFQEHRYTIDEFTSAVADDVIRVDFPACHLVQAQILSEMTDFTILSIASDFAGSRSGMILPVVDIVLQSRH